MTTDTVIVTEQVRDTVIVIGHDESMVRALLECDSTGQVRMKELLEYRAGSRLRPPELQIRDNILTARAECDSLQIYLQWKDRYERRTTALRQEALQTVEVNRLNRWQKMWIRLGQGFAAAIVIMLIFWIRKKS